MKTYNKKNDSRAGRGLLRCALGGLACVSGAWALPASGETAETAAKDYTMFVGDDLAVRDAKGRSPVVGVDGNTVLVRDRAAVKKVPLPGIQGLSYERGVKLSSLSADVNDVKVSFSSDAANQAWFNATSVQMALQDHAVGMRDRAGADMRRLTTFMGPEMENNVAEAQAKMIAGIDEAGGVAAMSQMYGEETNRNTALAGNDTVKVTFAVSSPRTLGKGYVALLAEYENQGAVERGISIKEFDRLDAKPRKFTLHQRGLPPGAFLKSYRIAVYADGQEVATNLSERRTAVTKDEAHKFYLLQYLVANKGQTRGPSMIAMVPKPQLKAAAREVELPAEIFVKVDKSGAALSLSTDRSGQSKVSPETERFMTNLRFLPALENGTPIEGSVRLAATDVLR